MESAPAIASRQIRIACYPPQCHVMASSEYHPFPASATRSPAAINRAPSRLDFLSLQKKAAFLLSESEDIRVWWASLYRIRRGGSGFSLPPKPAPVLMRFGFLVFEHLELRSFLFSKIWSKPAFGRPAISLISFHFGKCLIGVFLCLVASFWFPLLIALSGRLL